MLCQVLHPLLTFICCLTTTECTCVYLVSTEFFHFLGNDNLANCNFNNKYEIVLLLNIWKVLELNQMSCFWKRFCIYEKKNMKLANVWEIINLKSLHKKKILKYNKRGNLKHMSRKMKQLLSIILIHSQTAKPENMKTFSEKVIKIIFWFNVTKILKPFFLNCTRARIEFHNSSNFFFSGNVYFFMCLCVYFPFEIMKSVGY